MGVLMVLLGFAWFLSTLRRELAARLHARAVVGGLWGGVFLHLGMTFPSGRLRAAARPRGS